MRSRPCKTRRATSKIAASSATRRDAMPATCARAPASLASAQTPYTKLPMKSRPCSQRCGLNRRRQLCDGLCTLHPSWFCIYHESWPDLCSQLETFGKKAGGKLHVAEGGELVYRWREHKSTVSNQSYHALRRKTININALGTRALHNVKLQGREVRFGKVRRDVRLSRKSPPLRLRTQL